MEDRIKQVMASADDTVAGNETYTVGQLTSGVFTRDPNGGARTDVTPTASALIASTGFNLTTNNDCGFCYLINTADAAEAITLSAGTGVTISNVGQTIGQNESALLIFRRTSATAVTLYIVGA